MPMRKKCLAIQSGDSAVCDHCDQSWDMNDPDPPACLCESAIPNFLRKDAPRLPSIEIPDILEAARNVFQDRDVAYGSNYKRFGALLLALFPEGGIPAIRDEASANRLTALMDCAGKLHRYAHNFESGGHGDSASDLIVYAAMLKEFTR